MRQAKRDASWKEIETEGKWQKKNMKQTDFTAKREMNTKREKTRRYTKGKKKRKKKRKRKDLTKRK